MKIKSFSVSLNLFCTVTVQQPGIVFQKFDVNNELIKKFCEFNLSIRQITKIKDNENFQNNDHECTGPDRAGGLRVFYIRKSHGIDSPGNRCCSCCTFHSCSKRK